MFDPDSPILHDYRHDTFIDVFKLLVFGLGHIDGKGRLNKHHDCERSNRMEHIDAV